jgi:hypothetical protein
MPIVNIPNVGQVNFPDSMPQEAILAAIQNDILPNYANKQAQEEQPQAKAPAQPAPTNEKPSILAGTKLGPEERITPFNSPVGPEEMPTSLYTGDISKMPKDWGVGETLLQSAKVGIPQLLGNISATGFRANASIINKIDAVEQQLAAGKKNFTIEEDPLGVADMTAEQRAKFRADTESALGNRAAGIAQRQAEAEAIPQNPIVQKVMKAGKEEGLSGFIDEFKKDPVNFVAAIGPSSLVSNAPGMLAAIPATIAGGPGLGATVMGIGSFATDYPSTIISALAENGVDIKDPEALKAAAKDKELMDKVGKQAFAHASAVGAIDAISAGVASKVPLPKSVMKTLENKPVARELTNLALQSPIQGTLGASGEALGQLAAGQQLDWGNIGAEFAGEFFGTPVEVAAVSAGRAKEVAGEKISERAEIKAKAAEDAAYKTAMSNILASKGFVFSSPQEQQGVVDTLTAETEVSGDKESRFTTLLNKLKDFNNAKEEELGALIDSIKGKFATQEPATVPTPPPAPGPVVQTAAGTPIPTLPLDTAIKATEAKANAPIQPTASIDEQVQAKAAELGIPLVDAQKLVAEETQSGTKPNIGVNAGVNQPSVPMPEVGLQPAGGVTTPQPTGLASPIGVTGQPGVRTEAVQTAQPAALTEGAAATTGVMHILQQASDGFTISQQEYAQTGQSPTLKKVKSYLTKSFTPLLGPKKTKAYVNYLTEEGGLDSSDYGSNHELFGEAVNKMVVPSVTLNKQAVPEATTPTTAAPAPEVTAAPTPAAEVLAPTKGKRTGRPAAVLTPEEAAAKKQAKAVQTKEWKATDKQIAAAKAVLELPEPSRDEFKTQDAYLDAGMRYRTDRNQALDTLHAVATGPQRAGKLGATAKVGLDHPSISTQERAGLQQRIDLKKQGVGKVSKATQATTNGTYDPKYENFNTVRQVIDHIKNTGTAFEKALIRRLEPFLKGVHLVILHPYSEQLGLRTTDGTLENSFKGANGMYASWTNPNTKEEHKYIFLRSSFYGNKEGYQGMNNTIFLHEALHAAINARIDEWRRLLAEKKYIPEGLGKAIEGLQKAMMNAQDEYARRKLAGEYLDVRLVDLFDKDKASDNFNDLKEFVSYGLTDEDVQKFLLETRGEAIPDQPGMFRSLFNAFTNAIRQMFSMDRNHQSALQDLILTTEGLLQHNLQGPTAPGMSAARQKKAKAEKISQNVKKVMLSQKLHDIADGLGGLIREGHDFADFKDYLDAKFKGMNQASIKSILYVLRTSDIIRWMGDKIPGLAEIDGFTQKMAAMRTNMLDAYAKKADELAKFIVSGKENAKIIGNAMHLARLNGVTPDAHATAIDAAKNDPKIIELEKEINDPATDPVKLPGLRGQVTRRKNEIQVVYDAWAQLGKIDGGQKMYQMVRQFYKDNYTLTRHLLDERIERLQELPGDAADEKTPKGQLMAEIRKMQEKDAIKEYFPLMRHGSVWLRQAAGDDKGFILFDDVEARELYKIKEARKANKTVEKLFQDNQMSEGNDIASLRRTNQNESRMLKNMFEIIDKHKLDAGTHATVEEAEAAEQAKKDELKDQLYQTWLMTLPESSIRKQFLHAENVSGFSADIFRNFTESANRMASQIPRLKYADQMESEITRARDSLAGNPDQAKLGLFIDTVGRRGIEQLNPPAPNAISSALTRYAYYMLLTGAASAAVQLVAVPVMIYPVMAARYGVGKASAKFAAYSNILNSMGLNIKEAPETIMGRHIPSITASVADSKRVKDNPTLAKAYAELKERGLFAFTENNLLSQRGRTPLNATLNLPKKALRMTANIMSGLFSGSERISREIGAMMAFELHYEKTKNFEESIDKAIAAVQDNMGRYDAMERPEAFKYAPVVSQFKMYAANMTSFFIRHAYTSTQVMKNPKEAAESMKILGGVLMMGAMFHGLKGMPLYSTVGAVIEALSDLGEDDEERRKKRAKNPLVYQNADLRFRQFLHDNFGPVTADMLYSGPISSATDINIGSKTSFDNLWFRGGKPAKTAQEAFNNFALANIGPAVSGILGQAGAIDDFENGHIERGLEKMLPAFFKNPLVAARFAMEGVKTKGGDTIIKKEDVTAANIIAQAAGAAPTRATRQQELGYELKGEFVKAQQERTKVLQRLNDAVMNKDFTGEKKDVQPAINQIRQFNNKFPMDKIMIDADAIQNTLDSALQARALTYKGTRIPTEDMIPYFIPVLNQGRK